MIIPIVENVLKLNDEVAKINRERLQQAEVITVNLMGAPGCGKTALLEETIRSLHKQLNIGVVAGDLATQRDAERIARFTSQVVQVNTGKGCHLDANQVRQALDALDLESLDVLFIENVGNLICPVGFDLGQDVKVGMFSVSEGDDKPAKHPYIVTESDLLLLNKSDLLPCVPFDLDRFNRDICKLNPTVKLLEISVMKMNGLNHWFEWLLTKQAGRDIPELAVQNWCG